jgi:hypothetical protein
MQIPNAGIPVVMYKKPCWGSVTFWSGSGSPDPYLSLMDPDPTLDPKPDPTPDPTPFFNDFKDVKKLFFV